MKSKTPTVYSDYGIHATERGKGSFHDEYFHKEILTIDNRKTCA